LESSEALKKYKLLYVDFDIRLEPNIYNEVTAMAEMIEKVLERSVGKTVLIKVRGGKTLRGTLEGFDQHVNLYMMDSEDVSDPMHVKAIGNIVLRGDNVIMISPPPE
jgi:small nuclear ribonucleoprotein